ncbi:hypothetical protein GCM10020256_58860 [Streptomyces thermocoprophilus]
MSAARGGAGLPDGHAEDSVRKGGGLAAGSGRDGRPGGGPGRSATQGVADAGAGHADRVAGTVAASAFPERVARLDGGSYLLASGTRADLGEGSALRGSPWIAVAVADRPVGNRHARVRLAAAIDEDLARSAAKPLIEEREEVHWADGDVLARRVERLGAIELTVRPLADADPALIRRALLEGLRQEGLGLLRWSAEAVALRQRLAFLRLRVGDPWPDVSDEALFARVDEWLEPELGRARRRADLARIDAGAALGRLLPWTSGEAGRAGRAGAGADHRAERVEDPRRLRRSGAAGAGGEAAGDVRPAGVAVGGGGCRYWSTSSPPPGGPSRSPPTWSRSGGTATAACGRSCGAAIRSIRGRRTRQRRNRPGTPTHGSDVEHTPGAPPPTVDAPGPVVPRGTRKGG